MTRNVLFRLFDKSHNSQIDKRSLVPVNGHSVVRFNAQGDPLTDSILNSFEYFELLPAAAVAVGTSKLVTVLGTTPTVIQSPTGGVQLQSIATATNQAGVGAVATTGFTALLTGANQLRFSSRVSLPVITKVIVSAGLNQTPADVDPSVAAGDGAAFVFDPDLAASNPAVAPVSGANWLLHSKVAGVDTWVDSGVKVLAAQDYDLRIELDANKVPSYYINDVLVGTNTALATGGANVGVCAGIRTTEALAKVMHIRFARLSRLIG